MTLDDEFVFNGRDYCVMIITGVFVLALLGVGFALYLISLSVKFAINHPLPNYLIIPLLSGTGITILGIVIWPRKVN